MILNYIKRLMSWGTEREDYGNITFRLQRQILKGRYLQRQILKGRYNGEKQDKLYKSPPKFSRSVIRYINLTSQDTKQDTQNVILFKKKLRKLN